MISINNKIEESLYDAFAKFQGNELLLKIINSLPLNQTEAYKIYLKITHLIIDYRKTKDDDLTESWMILLKMIDKFENNSDIMIYNLEAISKFSNTKKFKDMVDSKFVELVIRIMSNTDSKKIASSGMQILDSLLKINETRELIRNNKLLTFIVKLLTRFDNDEILCFVSLI